MSSKIMRKYSMVTLYFGLLIGTVIPALGHVGMEGHVLVMISV